MKAERITQPGPSLLERLPSADQQTLGLFTHEIEIGLGCGGRPCRMCCYNAPEYQGSMPMAPIRQFHDIKSRFNPRTPLRHYRAFDVIYYLSQENGEERMYDDVYRDALEKGITPDIVLTHGFMPDEEQPQRAAARLVALAETAQLEPFMGLSIDPYGYVDIDHQEQITGIKATAAAIGPLLKTVYAFYNPEDNEYGLEKVQDLVRSALPQQLQDLVEYEKIHGMGRMASLDRRIKTKIPPPVGYSIRANGDVFFSWEEGADGKKIGNIYRGLPQPLPAPIPRAPDFDDF